MIKQIFGKMLTPRDEHKEENEIIASVDIGFSMVRVVIVKVSDKETTKVIGIGESRSRGMRRGYILNIIHAAEAVKEALLQAQSGKQMDIKLVNVNFGGEKMGQFNSKGEHVISDSHYLDYPFNKSKGKLISKHDLKILEDNIYKSINIPPDIKPIHVLPKEYKVDNESNLTDPEGMKGNKISCDSSVITFELKSYDNLAEVFQSNNIEIEKYFLQQWAGSSVVLTDYEKKNGALYIDMGANTTDVLVMKNNLVYGAFSLSVGGDDIAKEIANVFFIDKSYAERIKRVCTVMKDKAMGDKCYAIETVSGGDSVEILEKNLSVVIQAFIELEIIKPLTEKIKKEKFAQYFNHIIISGGMSLSKNIKEFFEQNMGLQVRLGKPTQYQYDLAPHFDESYITKLCSPEFSTVLGLLYLSTSFKNKEKGLVMEQSKKTLHESGKKSKKRSHTFTDKPLFETDTYDEDFLKI